MLAYIKFRSAYHQRMLNFIPRIQKMLPQKSKYPEWNYFFKIVFF
jgi:hypothetical protein